MVDPNSELFRAKQQVIYYRAEIAQYKNKIGELERLLEKEVVRNKYLQAKVRELNREKITGLQEEILRLRKKVMELEVELEEERKLQETISRVPLAVKENIKKEDFYSYFNYSVILPTEGDDTLSVYGDFTIVNIGDIPPKDMVVCFKVKPLGEVTLSGKISDSALLNGPGRDREDIDWVWATKDWRDRIQKSGEYWIKPIHPTATSKITLHAIEILFSDTSCNGKVKVEAFIYLDGNSPPISSLNKINFQIP